MWIYIFDFPNVTENSINSYQDKTTKNIIYSKNLYGTTTLFQIL